jgi:hypothetical protein
MSTGINTNTKIDAKYLGSKIAADLRQLQILYGKPSNSDIDSYVDEFITLIKEGYIKSVDYGYRKNEIWIVGVSYEVSTFNSVDDSPGKIPVDKDITGATWGSYMRKSQKFYNLSSDQQLAVLKSLPFQRSINNNDPQNGANWTYDKAYGSGDVELKRKTFN